MKRRSKIMLAVATLLLAGGASFYAVSQESATLPLAAGFGPNPTLPPPVMNLVPTVNIAKTAPWKKGQMPTALPGFKVTAFATGLDHPRWLHVLPNGDVLVAESNRPPRNNNWNIRDLAAKTVMAIAGAEGDSANRISLLRDTKGVGIADVKTTFLSHLHSPFGMSLSGGKLYVANADGIAAFPYVDGETEIKAPVEIITELPAGINHHWTKDVIASKDGTKLYATVGSNSNVAERGMEQEKGRAAIWEIDLATKAKRLFATGLRNPNGLSWNPQNGALWVAVNERDELGSDLVPDYMTSVKDGGFYGWPNSYYGQHVDPRVEPQRPDLVAKAIKPDYALGAHTASLGLTFYESQSFPQSYWNGAFIGQHGSWNRRPFSGYKVIFVPFKEGKPDGMPQDFLTGFQTGEIAHGRPVGVAVDKTGALLVADDLGNTIWRVAVDKDAQ